LDSDNDFQGQGIKEDYNNLISFLDGKNISWHILEKRAMENYMPDEVLFDVRRNKLNPSRQDDKNFLEWIGVYEYLSDIQKDYLNYSGQKAFNELATDAQIVYRNQFPTNYSILSRGISYRDNETQGIEDDERRFKNAFPRLYLTSPLISKLSLNKRCGNDEIERIITQIKKML